ncbi:MAG: hypothetical protein KJO91_11070 [Gammaproteobacteria bacterium]|nr:hypothetical protein [Gammaproteobacteria bacterium]
MKILKTLMVLPIACLISMPVFAHQYDHDGYSRFDKRVDKQKSRIRQGVKSGELTRKEASKLRHQQKKIAKLERKLSRDGYLTRHERKKLNRRQNKASERIYRLKHNDQSRDHGHQHHKSHRGHHDGRYNKPYYNDYGYRLSGNDGWALVLRLSDYF